MQSMLVSLLINYSEKTGICNISVSNFSRWYTVILIAHIYFLNDYLNLIQIIFLTTMTMIENMKQNVNTCPYQ